MEYINSWNLQSKLEEIDWLLERRLEMEEFHQEVFFKINQLHDELYLAMNQLHDELYERINVLHDELYDKARTFDGILYDTIEQAETAQKEKAELDEIMVGYDPANLDVMKKKQREIESKQLTVYNKEEYLKKIEIDIENYDQSLRTVQGVTYDTLDEANLAKKEQEIVESIISNINEKNQEDILRDIDKINAQKFLTLIPKPYIKKCYKD